MGNVAVTIKIMPASPDVDIEKIKSAISKKMKVQDAKIEPLAFGLKQLRILVVVPDTGGTDKLENQIKRIEGVGEVEVESVTLV